MQHKIIKFCSDTRGSSWWLMARIMSIAAPILIVPSTLLIGLDFFPIQKMFAGVLLSEHYNSFWIGIMDVFLVYLMIFSETFLYTWKRHVFMVDPAVEFYGWDTHILKFNSEKEVYFFKIPFGKKGYWLQPLENPRYYAPVRYSQRK